MFDIRTWYRRQPRWVHRTNALLLLFFAIGFAGALLKSGSEFSAIAWHFRHGNSITVNGATFPVYYWYAPAGGREGFQVWDQPGPLRPANDTSTMLTISGRRNQQDVGTPQELVQRTLRDVPVSGFEERSTFEWNTRSQTLECMQGRSARTSVSIIFCYGDGPIYSVWFTGGDDGLNRLKQAIAETK
jgi:hypothetical protein